MKKSIAVIGLGRFGLSLVESFSRLNVDIIAIDQNKESVKSKRFVHNVYVVDSTDEEALKVQVFQMLPCNCCLRSKRS